MGYGAGCWGNFLRSCKGEGWHLFLHRKPSWQGVGETSIRQWEQTLYKGSPEGCRALQASGSFPEFPLLPIPNAATLCAEAMAMGTFSPPLISPNSRRAVKKMNSLLAFTVLFALGLSPARGSLWDLHKLITKVTGKDALLHYSFYGCYCGLGGKGQPKDATDKCCQLHDTCYDSLLRYHCNAKVQGYHYGWHGSSPFCKGSSWCARLSCECDRSLALCLKRSIGSYSKRYRFYLKHWCW
ncbi:basic phospholipase A2 homolog Pgo-K49-like isoform X3 [Grus americana]|uniref:basic phospholipase A2 homolog Pgo-K49-like isoform X3 n=1 Tax=Grus americana TaxID=9117 RepID=UPI002407D2A9|nr:basic phospholipase A2 homolog Pgo-K49-like isoform X3 [Grus americana]